MHAEGLSWSTLVWCFRSPVRHLVESRVHLIHQVHVKPAEKSPVLLRVSEHLSPLHLVAHDPHNSMLQKKEKKTPNNTVCRQTDKHKTDSSRYTSQNFVCSHPDLVLEGKVSPRRNKCVHQLDPHLVPAEVLLPALVLRPKQLLVLFWDLVHHVAHLLAEVQHRLPEKNTHALGRKVSFLRVVRVSVYFFRSAGSRWKWRFRCDQLCHPEGNKKHVFRTLTSHSVGVRLAL